MIHAIGHTLPLFCYYSARSFFVFFSCFAATFISITRIHPNYQITRSSILLYDVADEIEKPSNAILQNDERKCIAKECDNEYNEVECRERYLFVIYLVRWKL